MKRQMLKIATILIVYLMVFLPVAFAVTISNPKADVKNNRADFSWDTDVSANSKVEWGPTSQLGSVEQSNSFVTQHSIAVTGLLPSTDYFYRMVSTDQLGNTQLYPYPNPAHFKTPDAYPPAAPTGLISDDATKTTVSLSWDVSIESDFNKFTLYRDGNLVYEGGPTSFIDQNLNQSTNYNYQLSVWDDSGNEGAKSLLSVTTLSPDLTPPSITNVSLVLSLATSAKIAWQTDDLSTSTVYYRTDTGEKSTDGSGVTRNHEVLVTGLGTGKTVYYTVGSCNEDGVCANSSQQGFIAGVDITPPTLESVSIEDLNRVGDDYLYGDNVIDIDGVSEPFVLVNLFVGGAFAGSSNADENGTFSFTNIGFLGYNTETITLDLTDPAGNSKEFEYSIVFDFDDPVVNANLNGLLAQETITFNASVNEVSDVEVYVVPYNDSDPNNIDTTGLSTEFSKRIDPPGTFLITLSLEQGKQTVVIRAADLAGNIGQYAKLVTMDNQPPMLEDVDPNQGDWFYTDAINDLDVEGKTTPNATVRLWVNKGYDDDPDETLKAGADGKFEFKNVNFARFGVLNIFSFSTHGSSTPEWVNELPTDFKLDPQTWMRSNKFFFLQAENSVGLKTEPPESYQFEARTCYDGNFSWGLNFKPEYQSPQFMSVERLEEGTERLAFFFELSYFGGGKPETAVVEDIWIETTEFDTAMQDEDWYNLTSKIVRGIRYDQMICDPTNRKCYVLAEPPAVADLTQTMDFSDWKDFFDAVSNKLVLPLQFHIKYKYEDFAGKEQFSDAVVCKQISYTLDNTKLDFSKLPDWLVEDGVKFMNNSIDVLDDLMDKAMPVIEAVTQICSASFLVKTVVTIYRRFMERVAKIKDKAGKKVNVMNSCYEKLTEGGKKAPPDNYLAKLSNKDLEDCYHYLYSAWNWEKNIYKAYRASCDRIFCKSAPARWTGNEKDPDDGKIKGYEDVLTYVQTKEKDFELSCNQDMALIGQAMRKTICPEDELKTDYEKYAGKKECYVYEDNYWIIDNEVVIPNQLTLKRITDIETANNKQSKGINILKAVTVPGDDNMLFTARYGTCNQNCEAFGYSSDTEKVSGGIMKYKDCAEKRTNYESGRDIGITYGTESNEFDLFLRQGQEERKTNPYTCCCFSSISVDYDKDTINPYGSSPPFDSDKLQLWDYRYSKTGYIYPKYEGDTGYSAIEKNTIYSIEKKKYNPYLYFAGRDVWATFGQNNIIDKNTPYLDSRTQHSTAFQTACLTGIYKRLEAIRNIIASVRNCIESVKYTNSYSSQTCKSIFSQYVCSAISGVIVKSISGCNPLLKKKAKGGNADDEASVLDYLGAGAGGIFEGIDESITDLETDYEDAAVSELFGGGVGGAMEKACMASFGYDWDLDINTILDAAYETQFASNVLSVFPRRGFLFINPTTRRPIFEYRGGVYIMPGCDINSYKIDLVCVNYEDALTYGDKGISCPTDDDCLCLDRTEDGESPYVSILSGGALTQSIPEEQGFSKVLENSNYVYDHVRVKLSIDPDKKEKCLPEGYEEGVFYAPIADRTSINLLGCEARINGVVECVSGISEELGFANMNIYDVDMPNQVVVGQTLKAYPYITKTGDGEMCMFYKVIQGDPDTGRTVTSPTVITIPKGVAYQNQKYGEGINVFDGGIVPTSVLGGSARITGVEYVSPSGTTKGIAPSYSELPGSDGGTLRVYLKDNNKNGEFGCKDGQGDYKDTYSIDNINFKTFPESCVVSDGGKRVKIDSFKMPDGNTDRDITVIFTITAGSDTAIDAQLTLRLWAAIPDDEGTCQGSGVKIIPNSEFDKPFTVFRELNTQGVKDCYVNELEPVKNDCACGSSLAIDCYADREQYCYKQPNNGGTIQCVSKASDQAKANLVSSFGTPLIYESSGSLVAKKDVVGHYSYILTKGNKYIMTLTKPTSFGSGDFNINYILVDGTKNSLYVGTSPREISNKYEFEITPSLEGRGEIVIEITPSGGNKLTPIKTWVSVEAQSDNSCGSDNEGTCQSQSCSPEKLINANCQNFQDFCCRS